MAQSDDIVEFPKDLIPELVKNPTLVKPQQGLDYSTSPFYIPPPQPVLYLKYGDARHTYPSFMIARPYIERGLVHDDTEGFIVLVTCGAVRSISTVVKVLPGEDSSHSDPSLKVDYTNWFWWKPHQWHERPRMPLVFWFPRKSLLEDGEYDCTRVDGTLSTPQGWRISQKSATVGQIDGHSTIMSYTMTAVETMVSDKSQYQRFASDKEPPSDYRIEAGAAFVLPDECPPITEDSNPYGIKTSRVYGTADTFPLMVDERPGYVFMSSVWTTDVEHLYKNAEIRTMREAYSSPLVDRIGGSPYRRSTGTGKKQIPFDVVGVGEKLGILGIGEGRAVQLWMNPNCNYNIDTLGKWTPLQD